MGIAPSIAPLVLGLNNSATFLGTTAAGIIGAVGIKVIGGNYLGLLAAALAAAALVAAELAARSVDSANSRSAAGQRLVVPDAGAPERTRA